MPNKIDFALKYAARGWRVIPLHHPLKPGICSCGKAAKCGSAGKHPRIRDWQNQASTYETQIGDWWSRWPDANIGVQLGKSSGIIDIDCDTPEAEEAVRLIFGGPDGIDMAALTSFRSHRGMHYILDWSDVFADMSVIHSFGIEVRVGNGGGAQTVFPGSVHGTSGKTIEWVNPPQGW